MIGCTLVTCLVHQQLSARRCFRSAAPYLAVMRNLMTKKEVAAALRVSTRTICRYMKLGWLSPIRLSEQVVRFAQDEVDRFIEEGPGARSDSMAKKVVTHKSSAHE